MTKLKLDEIAVKLGTLAKANHTFENIAKDLLQCDRHRKITDLRQYSYSFRDRQILIDASDYARFWRELQKLGVGRVIEGRDNMPPRFEWNINRFNVAVAAKYGKNFDSKVLSEEFLKRKARLATHTTTATHQKPSGREEIYIAYTAPDGSRTEMRVEPNLLPKVIKKFPALKKLIA